MCLFQTFNKDILQGVRDLSYFNIINSIAQVKDRYRAKALNIKNQ